MIDEAVSTNIYRGGLIKKAMDDQNLTFDQVAEKSGVTRPTIYRIIESDKKVSIGRLCQVADAVNVSHEALFQKEEFASA